MGPRIETKCKKGSRVAAPFANDDLRLDGCRRSLFELSQALGNSLSLDETLSVMAVRLKRLIPHDSIAVYTCKDGYLVPEYVFGENFREFASLRIPIGEGLCGWVAEKRKPIVNGNPLVEPGFLKALGASPLPLSALAVPLEGVDRTIGVLALYRRQKDAFTGDHLRILLAISAKLGFSIENALKYQTVENSATTDYLTGLPNARSLFLHRQRTGALQTSRVSSGRGGL